MQHSSFFYALWAAGAALAAALLGTGARPPSWGSALALAACFAVPVAIMLPSSVTFMAHIMEKVRGKGCFSVSPSCFFVALPQSLGTLVAVGDQFHALLRLLTILIVHLMSNLFASLLLRWAWQGRRPAC